MGEHGFPGVSIGSNGNLYSRPFYGNQYVSTLRLGATGKLGGWALAPISIGVDAYAFSQGQITGGKFGLNTGMTGVGLAGGPVGAIFAVPYFVGDSFVLPNEGGLWNAAYDAWQNADTFR